eukprot:1155957-Pelagomonas_calceolata.AAC.4
MPLALFLAIPTLRPEVGGPSGSLGWETGAPQACLQIMQAACGPAESDGGNRLVNLPPSLTETVYIQLYLSNPFTEQFRRSKS